jgi:nucleoid-associated protein YgaU
MNLYRRRASATVIGSGYVLKTFLPEPHQLVRALRSPHVWVANVGPDAAVGTIAGALLWLVALWLAFGMAVTVLALAPGRLGLLASALADRVTPALLRRVGIAAAGASILASPAAAFADTAGGSPAASGPSATGVPLTPAPTLPVSTQPPAGIPHKSLPPLSWPTDPAPASTGAARTSTAGERQRNSQQVTVHPGDSLWSITAQRLSPATSDGRIQAEWPRWYAANRRLIGADPNLLLPGIKLRVPQPASSSTEK